MPMKDRAQAHTGTLASKSCFREQMPSENIRFYPLANSEGDAFMCFEDCLVPQEAYR